MSPAFPLIRVAAVDKSFELGSVFVKALKEVNVDIDERGLVALMGPSGSGKSTLLNLIGALDTPTHGEILFRGTSIVGLTPNERARFRNERCGFIFQNFNLMPVLTPMENVLLPLQLSRKGVAKDQEKRAVELLVKVGLGEQLNQSVNRLSGGQMQRVAIARALVNNPEIILADEPTANLDHATADVVMEMLKELCEREGTTVVIATHDHSVLRFCRRIISMRDGRIVGDEIVGR